MDYALQLQELGRGASAISRSKSFRLNPLLDYVRTSYLDRLGRPFLQLLAHELSSLLWIPVRPRVRTRD